jgi:hypothetical protein
MRGFFLFVELMSETFKTSSMRRGSLKIQTKNQYKSQCNRIHSSTVLIKKYLENYDESP